MLFLNSLAGVNDKLALGVGFLSRLLVVLAVGGGDHLAKFIFGDLELVERQVHIAGFGGGNCISDVALNEGELGLAGRFGLLALFLLEGFH